MMDNSEVDIENSIAIIGMAGRFPGAETVEQFWDNLCQGINSISKLSVSDLEASGVSPKAYNAINYVRAKGVLKDIDLFDADFFGFTAKEAQITDPQHRLFLECAWEALENSGYCSDNYAGSIGVYGGTGMSSYFLNNINPNEKLKETLGEYLVHIGNEKDFLTTRVSYKLNLKGPSINIQSACSTSLVAICTACNHLLSYQCDMALAGAAAISIPQGGYHYQEGMIFSPDGQCRPFDAEAKGTTPGNGVGIVVLKRLKEALEDGDHIYASIRGYGLNNDGMEKIGYSAPSVQGQADAISQAISMAGIETDTINYAEAHGTGTILGDPIEIEALTQAFRMHTENTGYCSLGSVKGNVGHLIEAAGVTGLIKTALSLERQLIPPTINFTTSNPHIDFKNSPFHINATLENWPKNKTPRRACVSSFGMGGTNAHVILEETPQNISTLSSHPYQLLVLSARTSEALKSMTNNLGHYLQDQPTVNLADVAYTLQMGRKSFKHRKFLVSHSIESAISSLLQPQPTLPSVVMESPDIVFVMTDKEDIYLNMGLGLYQSEPCYRQVIDECSSFFESYLGLDLRNILFPSENLYGSAAEQLTQPLIANSILFMTQWALIKLWEKWGLRPQSLAGQGIGHCAAGCLAGVFTFQEALSLVIKHGQLVKALEDPKNIVSELEKFVSGFNLRPPNTSLTLITATEAISPLFWAQLLLDEKNYTPEKFHHLSKRTIFLEVGPGAKPFEQLNSFIALSSLPCKDSSQHALVHSLSSLGQLWASGAQINWKELYKEEQRHRVPLPTYPFEKKRHWIDPPTHHNAKSENVQCHSKDIRNYTSLEAIHSSLIEIWKDLIGANSLTIHDDFFTLGGDSLTALQVIAKIESCFEVPLRLQVLIEYPTVAQLAEHLLRTLLKNSSTELPSALVKLKSGIGTPLFMIHPIGGHVFCYKPLANSLKQTGPIYGIQAEPYENKKTSIEAIASNYIQAIRSVQPQGPYYLLGASFGGLIAFEMANQLMDAQQELGSLTMLDIIKPDSTSRQLKTDTEMMALLIELFEGHSISITQLKMPSHHQQLQRLMKSMGLDSLSTFEQQKIYEQVKTHWQALINYTPKPYPGEILFFEAKERFLRNQDISLGESWQDLALGGMQIYDIPGNHLTMIMSPHVDTIAKILETHLLIK